MKIERTNYGFTWGDMELICMSEDDTGRVFMTIKRGRYTHQLCVSKGGKAVLQSATGRKSEKQKESKIHLQNNGMLGV